MGEKKEDDEGVPFYLLLTSGMHHGDRNLAASYLRWGDRNLAGDKGLVVSSMLADRSSL